MIEPDVSNRVISLRGVFTTFGMFIGTTESTGGAYTNLDYPQLLNIELHSSEEHNVSYQHAWGMSHAVKQIGQHRGSLQNHLNLSALRVTNH